MTEVEHFDKLFDYTHLPAGPLRETSRLFRMLYVDLVHRLPAGRERTAGFRKLLEAKDCAVRSAL